MYKSVKINNCRQYLSSLWILYKTGSAGIKRTILLGGLFETLIDPTSPNSGIEPGARMAIDAVNADLTILPSYKLTLAAMETGCSPETSLLSYFKFYEDRASHLQVIFHSIQGLYATLVLMGWYSHKLSRD